MFIHALLYWWPIHSYIITYPYNFIICGFKGHRSHHHGLIAQLQHSPCDAVFFLQTRERRRDCISVKYLYNVF